MLTIADPAHLDTWQSRPLMSEANEIDLYAVWAQKIRASDSAAFEAFFRAVHGPLVGYADGIVHDPATASDLVQEAFVKIWEGRERIDPAQSLKAFAYRTVRNLCLNFIRDSRTRATLLEGADLTTSTPQAGPDALLGEADLSARLVGWIDALPDRQREALVLSRYEGLSHDEIADAMGVSARTVNNHLVKALRTIRASVRAYVVGATVASTDLTEGQTVTTLATGGTFTVNLANGPSITDGAGNEVAISITDVPARNGVIHILDAVILPN